jgi:hypothetical protein
MAESEAAEVQVDTPADSQQNFDQAAIKEPKPAEESKNVWNSASQQIKYLQSLIDKVMNIK